MNVTTRRTLSAAGCGLTGLLLAGQLLAGLLLEDGTTGAASLAGAPRIDASDAWTSGADTPIATKAVDEKAPYAADRPLPEPVVFAPGVISTGDDDAHPTFTDDGRTVYFAKTTASMSYYTLVMSTFSNGRWSRPVAAPFSGQYADTDVFFTKDGSRLYFVSRRPVNGGKAKADPDIWVMKKAGSNWGEPEHVAELNTDGDEWFPTLTDSGTIYFGSDRPGGKGGSDIWRARVVNGRFTTPENLGDAINSPGNEVEAYIAPDESYMIFAASGRPGGHGSYDLYVSSNEQGRWTSPRNLGTPINSSGWEFGMKVSPDGRYVFYTSSRDAWDRPLGTRLTYDQLEARLRAPGNGRFDIYQVDLSAIKR